MGYDPDTCILCNRCVRYTQEVMQCSALSLEGRGPRRGSSRPGALLARHRVRALRRLPLHLPDRRDLREVPRGRRRRGARARAGQDDLHVLRRRLPDRPQRRSRDEADRQGHLRPDVRLERGQPLRQGPLRVQLRPPPRTASPSRSCAARTASCTPPPGSTRSQVAADGLKGVIERHSPRRSASSPPPGLTNEENYLIQKLARTGLGPTPSTPAKPPDTLRPFTAWSGRSAEELPPTRSPRSRTPASCS